MVLMEIITKIYDENDDEFVPILNDIVERIDKYKTDDKKFAEELNRIKGNLAYYCSGSIQESI